MKDFGDIRSSLYILALCYIDDGDPAVVVLTVL